MIRIAIVEDDQSADDQLTACLEKLSLQSKEVFDLSHYPDAQQFLFAFHSQFDLIFMDIEMPNMDGLSAARRMREIDSNVALVFVTNLARYAINGYEVSALDYILKPLDYDAFYLKMQKVLRYCQTQQQRRQQSVVIPTADGNTHLPLSELLYVEKKLSPHGFFRCNSCYLVNLQYIRRIDGYTVYVGETPLAISHPRRKDFLAAMTQFCERRANAQ